MDEQLIGCAADSSAEQRAGDGDPPVAAWGRKCGTAPAGKEGEEARAEVAGWVDGPRFEIAHGSADGRDEETDNEGAEVRAWSQFVVLLGDGKDSEDEECGEDDFIAEGMHDGDAEGGVREENAGGAAAGAGELIGEVEAIDDGGEEQVDDACSGDCADGLRNAVGE